MDDEKRKWAGHIASEGLARDHLPMYSIGNMHYAMSRVLGELELCFVPKAYWVDPLWRIYGISWSRATEEGVWYE